MRKEKMPRTTRTQSYPANTNPHRPRLPSFYPRISVVRKLFTAKRKVHKTPQDFFLAEDDNREKIGILSSYQTDEELHELHDLHAKVDLLHSFLPQEIVERIHHHWSQIDKNEIHNDADSLTYCSSLSSSERISIPQESILNPRHDFEETGIIYEESKNFSIYTFEKQQNLSDEAEREAI